MSLGYLLCIEDKSLYIEFYITGPGLGDTVAITTSAVHIRRRPQALPILGAPHAAARYILAYKDIQFRERVYYIIYFIRIFYPTKQ